MLVSTDVLGLRKRHSKHIERCEDNVLGTKTQIVVFKLGRPIIGEGIFQADANQQAIACAALRRSRRRWQLLKKDMRELRSSPNNGSMTSKPRCCNRDAI